MKNLLAIIMLSAAVLMSAVPALAADSKDDRIAATRDYLKAVPVTAMAGDLTSELMNAVPPEQQAMAAEVLKKALDPEFLESVTLAAMPKHFTTDEIKAMTRFYSSPEGASIMRKYGAYMADIMPAVQSRIMTILAP
jgi:hypothetical protein